MQRKTPDFEEHGGPYVQEHIHLLEGYHQGRAAQRDPKRSRIHLAAIMGRISAYSGQMVRWRELVDPAVNSPWYNLTLTPTAEDFETGTVTAQPGDIIPIPGRA